MSNEKASVKLADLFGQSCVGLGLHGDVTMGQPALTLFRPDEEETEEPVDRAPQSNSGNQETIEQTVDRFLAERRKEGMKVRTSKEYITTRRKLEKWWAVKNLHRSLTPMQISTVCDRCTLKDFLDWVFDQARRAGDKNPGRSA